MGVKLGLEIQPTNCGMLESRPTSIINSDAVFEVTVVTIIDRHLRKMVQISDASFVDKIGAGTSSFFFWAVGSMWPQFIMWQIVTRPSPFDSTASSKQRHVLRPESGKTSPGKARGEIPRQARNDEKNETGLPQATGVQSSELSVGR